MSQKSTTSALSWKLLERFGVAGMQFVLQIVLARILDPEHYGVLTVMLVFTNLANVFIQHGLNTALIQNKDVTEDDYSSIFWVNFGVSSLLYAIIFIASPLVGVFYNMPDIVLPLRVLALLLFPGALNSIQIAKVSREMDFRKIFIGNLGAIVVSGVVGIVMALNGMGLWALVGQSLLNVFVATVIMVAVVRVNLKFVCNFKRVGKLFSFGWKLTVSALIDTLYQDIRSLVIGKKYDSAVMGYYNRGKQFPQFLINSINGAVQSVMLPAMSKKQDNAKEIKDMVRRSISLSAYVIFPVMFGLAAVGTPLVRVLLGDKWLPCVPFMQIYCFSFAFYPVHSCNLQAINAIGRSDIYLRLEIIKKAYGILTLVIAVLFFDSPLAIAMTGLITTFLSCFVNAYPNKKLLNYSFLEQIKDLLPIMGISTLMFVAVYAINYISLPSIVLLMIQLIVGVVVYIILSKIFKISAMKYIMSNIKGFVGKKSQKPKTTYRMAKSEEMNSVSELLKKIDKSFPIPLSDKTDLDELANKFLEKGYVYLAFDGEKPIGILGFYANDAETGRAYFSVLGVLESHQGQGIAKRILMDSIAFCKEKGMTSCVLYTHKTNVGAIAMYEKLGFVAEDDPARPHDIKFVKEL